MGNLSRFFLSVNLLLISSGAYAVGSSKPKATPAPAKQRTLKKLIELDVIRAKPVLRQGQVAFDLQNAVNLQAISAAVNSGRFTVKSRDAGTFVVNSNTGGLQLMSVRQAGLVLNENERCLAGLPALRIGGEIIDFELESVTGTKLGFSPKLMFDIGFQAEFRVGKSVMTSVYTATDASRRRILHSTTITETQKENQGGMKVDFLDLAYLGFDYYKKTPLAQVVSKSINSGMLSIANATDKLLWDAPVIVAERSIIAINAGFDAGLEVGDEFKVQNMAHYWSGTPCKSDYFGSRPDPDPVAFVEVYDVQSTISWARVVRWNNSDSLIYPGARVQIEKLAQ